MATLAPLLAMASPDGLGLPAASGDHAQRSATDDAAKQTQQQQQQQQTQQTKQQQQQQPTTSARRTSASNGEAAQAEPPPKVRAVSFKKSAKSKDGDADASASDRGDRGGGGSSRLVGAPSVTVSSSVAAGGGTGGDESVRKARARGVSFRRERGVSFIDRPLGALKEDMADLQQMQQQAEVEAKALATVKAEAAAAVAAAAPAATDAVAAAGTAGASSQKAEAGAPAAAAAVVPMHGGYSGGWDSSDDEDVAVGSLTGDAAWPTVAKWPSVAKPPPAVLPPKPAEPKRAAVPAAAAPVVPSLPPPKPSQPSQPSQPPQTPQTDGDGGSHPASLPQRRIRANSCDSMFTVSKEHGGGVQAEVDVEEVLFATACYVQDRLVSGEAQAAERRKAAQPPPPHFHNEEVPSDTTSPSASPPIPDEDEIYDFLKATFLHAEFSAQCFVVMLVYVERLYVAGGVAPIVANWRAIVFTAVVLAAKVWDDTGSSNAEFARASGGAFTTKDLNTMEVRFLDLVKYQVNVSQALYASCYFELRALCERKDDDDELQRPIGAVQDQHERQRTAARDATVDKQRRLRGKSAYLGPAPTGAG